MIVSFVVELSAGTMAWLVAAVASHNAHAYAPTVPLFTKLGVCKGSVAVDDETVEVEASVADDVVAVADSETAVEVDTAAVLLSRTVEVLWAVAPHAKMANVT